jgi:hypothetical protein
VRPGGEWDLKPIIQRTCYARLRSAYWTQLESEGPEYYYDVWGNVNFGFVAMAGGFVADEALDGAGTAQFWTDLLRLKWPQRTPGVSGDRAYDDPADQIGIQLGFELWETYGLNVTPQNIVDAVKRTPGLTTR